MLKWLRANGINWNEKVCLVAAMNGHLEVLKWAREKGCPWDLQSCEEENYDFWLNSELFMPCAHHTLSIAAKDQLAILQFAVENGGTFHPETPRDAARGGHMETLKWAIANGCSWHPETTRDAARGGHTETLKVGD